MLTLGLLQAKDDFLWQVAPWNIYPMKGEIWATVAGNSHSEDPWENMECFMEYLDFITLALTVKESGAVDDGADARFTKCKKKEKIRTVRGTMSGRRDASWATSASCVHVCVYKVV